MRLLVRGRPSAPMVVSVIALVVALSGAAVAAGSLVSGDKLIKKRSLSGNRLRDHTITGQQVNLGKLGKVPSARNADHAVSADRATNATNAANAGIAGSANTLGGQSPSAFDASSNFVRSGLVTTANNAPIASFGPFMLTLTCTDNGSGSFTTNVQVMSNEANSESDGNQLTPGTPFVLFSETGSAFGENSGNPIDFATASGKTYESLLTAGVFFPGVSRTTPCFANALVAKS